MLLDIYAQKTNLPAAYFDYKQDEFIWSSAGTYSPLCELLNGKCGDGPQSCEACQREHVVLTSNPKEREDLCHAGLWNITLPIEINGKVVGTLVSGQRRLSGEDRQLASRRRFAEFLTAGISNRPSAELIACYEATPVIDAAEFDSKLLGNLKHIHEYIYRWHFEQEVERQQLRISIQSLAHELLLPIQSVIADAENLYAEVPEGELKDIANNIMEEMKKLAIIAENMRSALIGARSEHYEFAPHSSYHLLVEAIRLYEREARKKGVEIRMPVAIDNMPFPYLDMSYPQMTKAIHNIIHNAVKYSFSSRLGALYISICCKSENDYFEIAVSNFGFGILPQEIEEEIIFEAGYRGLLSADKHRTGSGLGLSIVKSIIEAHNGSVAVQSIKKRNDAYVTTVTVHLPYRHA